MLSKLAGNAQPCTKIVDEDELPNLQGWRWNFHRPHEYKCGTVAVSAWPKPDGEKESLPGEDRFAFILDGANSYLHTHGIREIDVPQYYSRFRDQFRPVVSEWTIRRYGRALGVGAGFLERTVRLANGKGHINHNELEVHLCDNRTLFVTGSRGKFVVNLTPLKEIHLSRTPPDSSRTNIQGLSIPEDDPDYRRGLRRFVKIFNQYTDTTLARYKRLADRKHIIKTSDNEDVYVGQTIRHLARMTTDETELYQTYSHHFDGEARSSTWDSDTTSHAIGEEIDRGVVVGYDHTWNEKEPIMGGDVYEVESNAIYWCFNPRPQKYSYYDFEIVSFEETIDSFSNRT